MKLEKITKGLTNLTGRTGLKIKKCSPEILLVMGIGSGAVATVLACRATLKVEGVLNNHKETVDTIKDVRESVKQGDIPEKEYSENDYNKDLAITYVKTGLEFVKIYGPAFSMGMISVGCLVGGHGIMRKRNVALMAAYKAVEESFGAYRKRVSDELGEEKDYIYKNGLSTETVTEVETDEEGKTKKVKKEKINLENADPSQYARFFDEGCKEWTKTPEYNLMFLKSQQNYFNDLLKVRGNVFLNEVYDALGIPRTKAGCVVGWVRGEGDNFIDFGIFDGDSEKKRDFVNGYERSILLDFNVDGVVYDLI